MNLEILTRKENQMRVKERRKPFVADEVINIRVRRQAGESLLDLAEDYCVTLSCISNISRGLSYAEVGGPITHGSQAWLKRNAKTNS